MSLQALQQAALGLAQGKVTEWLGANSLADRPRLPSSSSSSRVGSARSKPCSLVSRSGFRRHDRCDREPARIVAGRRRLLLLRWCQRAESRWRPAAGARARSRGDFCALLTGIIAVDTLSEALEKRRTLLSGESVITRDGVWIGREWLRVSRDKDVHAGVIGREKEMRCATSSPTPNVNATAHRRSSPIPARSLPSTSKSRRPGRGQPAASRRRRLERTDGRAAHEVRADSRACEPHRRRDRRAGARLPEPRRRHRGGARTLQEGIDADGGVRDRTRRAGAGARRAAPEPVVQALAGADRSGRCAGRWLSRSSPSARRCNRFLRASNGCTTSSSSCNSAATS